MKRIGVFFLALGISLCLPLLPVFGAVVPLEEEEDVAVGLDPEALMAASTLLMDAQTGQVLYSKDSDKRMFPASTTKILTCVMILEMLEPDTVITVNASAVDPIDPYEESNVALVAGERLSVRDALYALMLPSANDAANVLAEAAAGSQEEFARLMTEKAKEIGARNTHFTNAHGLHESNHSTTAYDMAVMTRYALQNPDFLTYFGEGRYTMAPTNMQTEVRDFVNYQWMLLPEMWVYNPDVIGGKTGYTDEAKSTMSSAATRDGHTLIAVVFQTGSEEKFYDTKTLLDFGFDEFVQHTIPAADIPDTVVPIFREEEQVGEATLSLNEDIALWLHQSVSLDAVTFSFDLPEAFQLEEDVAGSLTLLLEDTGIAGMPQELLTLELTPEVSIADLPVLSNVTLEEKSSSRFPIQLDLSKFNLAQYVKYAYVPVIVILASVILLIVSILGFRAYRQHQQRKARRARLRRRIQEYRKAS